MMEQVVSLETAQLLKEKGFDVKTSSHYELKEFWGDTMTGNTHNWNSKFYDEFDCVSAPTQALAQKWLRDNHRINIVLKGTRPYVAEVYDPVVRDVHVAYTPNLKRWDSYEEALEAGLKLALGLIKYDKKRSGKMVQVESQTA